MVGRLISKVFAFHSSFNRFNSSGSLTSIKNIVSSDVFFLYHSEFRMLLILYLIFLIGMSFHSVSRSFKSDKNFLLSGVFSPFQPQYLAISFTISTVDKLYTYPSLEQKLVKVVFPAFS